MAGRTQGQDESVGKTTPSCANQKAPWSNAHSYAKKKTTRGQFNIVMRDRETPDGQFDTVMRGRETLDGQLRTVTRDLASHNHVQLTTTPSKIRITVSD